MAFIDEIFDIIMACLIPGSIRFDFEHHLLSYISRNLGCLGHPVGEWGIIQREIWLWVSQKAYVQLFPVCVLLFRRFCYAQPISPLADFT